jgi:hypothetical protein
LLLFAVRHFRPFLAGREYIIRLDDKPSIYLEDMKGVESQLMHTLEDLNVGKYVIHYVPGK